MTISVWENYDGKCPSCGETEKVWAEISAVYRTGGGNHIVFLNCRNCGYRADCTCRVTSELLLPEGVRQGMLMESHKLQEIFKVQREWKNYWRNVDVETRSRGQDDVLAEWMENNGIKI